jgi:hypothetical protein
MCTEYVVFLLTTASSVSTTQKIFSQNNDSNKE